MFVVEVENRDKIMIDLKNNGIQTLIHYPIPIHLQECYRDLGYKVGDFPVAENASKKLISLPMYPELMEDQIKCICGLVNEYYIE